MPSKLETEIVKATKVKQAANESRPAYFVRILKDGQKMTAPSWDALSAEAQAWYNDSVRLYQAHNNPADIKEFPDLTPGTARATLAVVPATPIPPAPVEEEIPVEEEPAPVEEEEIEVEEEEAPVEEEEIEVEEEAPVEEEVQFEEDAPLEEEEEAPIDAAPAKPAAQKRSPPKQPVRKPPPAVKTPSKGPVTKVKVKTDAAITRPPKPAAPGASTVIKRLLLRDSNITNAELIEKLKERNISVTAISVSTIRSDFRHSLRVLQEAGYALELPAP